MTHPSFFALDAYVLDPRGGDVATHVQSCAQCQAHVAAAKVAVPFPDALVGLEPRTERVPTWWRWLALGLAAAVVLISVAWFATRTPAPQFAAKGTPAAALWLQREGKVTAWTGQPVRDGDTVRFELVPAGLNHVTVFDETTHEVLYEAQVPEGSTFTPAWQFDGAPSSESLRVVFSHGPVTAQSLEATCTTDASSHCARFTLTREKP
jgi:hypothetical protein